MTVQLTDRMELSADVEVTPIDDLPQSMRSGLEGYSEGYAVSRPLGRMRSRVVDSMGAELIESFRTPTLLVDAILSLSREHRIDPHLLLEDSLPLIAQLVADEVLVKEGHEAPRELQPSLAPGEAIGETTIVRPLYLLEDTEVYEASSADRTVALKLLRHPVSARAQRSFDREVAVLEHLGGECGPELLASGRHGESPYLIESWCDGGTVAQALVGLNRPSEVAALLSSVADAYALLHERGVLHGDVHPGNIIVSPTGDVRLIDFGQAALNGNAPERGGVIAHYEPEMANALRAGLRPPPPTIAGEQYALATILYAAVAGVPYLALPISQRDALRAISEDRPQSLADVGRGHLSALDMPLQRALAKSPTDRFPDMPSFAAALRNAFDDVAEPEPAAEHPLRARLRALGVVDYAAELSDRAPAASVFYGAGGISLGLLRVAQALDDPELLALSHLWIDLALRAEPETGFLNPEFGLDAERLRHGSPFHGLAGLYAVRAFIADAEGDVTSLGAAVASYLEIVALPESGFDPTMEQPATLWGLAAMRRLPSMPTAMAARIDEELLRIEGDVAATLRRRPRIADDIGAPVGVAHGYAGVVHALLAAADVRGGAPDREVIARLDELADLAHEMPSGLRWPWFVTPSGDLGRSMSGWCNGSAGMVGLWLAAASHWDEVRALALAEGAATDAWRDPSQIGNLCCGSAGRAFAQLAMYQSTGKAVWLERAAGLVETGFGLGALPTDASSQLGIVQHSLYKGEIGLIVAAAALLRPESVAMPLAS